MPGDSWSACLSRLAGAITLGAGCLVCGAAGPAVLAAQGTAELSPFVGAYLPTADVFEMQDVMVAGDRMVWKHKTTVVFGGRVGSWVSERVAVEASFGYAPSKAQVVYTDASNVTTTSDVSATILLGRVRVLVGIGPTGRNTSGYLVLGVGVTAHTGEAYSNLDITAGSTDGGPIVGVGGRIKVGQSIAIRLEVEDHLYSARFSDSSGAESKAKLQNDIIISLGLAIPFGGKQ